MVKVNVKWGKEKFDGVELDTSTSVETFKALLLSMTGVPVARQKLMVRVAALRFFRYDRRLILESKRFRLKGRGKVC